VLTESMSRDAEELFVDHDTEGTGLLSRGSLVELLRTIGFDSQMGETFRATARLAFDAHSADGHFLTLLEFKRLYWLLNKEHPKLLPRRPFLKIRIIRGEKLMAADVNGKSDPFCIVQVRGKPQSKSQTVVKEKTLEPIWDQEFDDKYAYKEGDALDFVVMDYDRPSGTKMDESIGELLGRTTLTSSDFHKPGGFEGDLRLRDCGKEKSTIRVKVVVNALEDASIGSPGRTVLLEGTS